MHIERLEFGGGFSAARAWDDHFDDRKAYETISVLGHKELACWIVEYPLVLAGVEFSQNVVGNVSRDASCCVGVQPDLCCQCGDDVGIAGLAKANVNIRVYESYKVV